MRAFLQWRVLAAGLVLLVGPVHSQNSEEHFRYLIRPDAFPKPAAEVEAAIAGAICDGKAEGGHCDTCPGGSSQPGIGFSLSTVILGHFVTPTSEDAFVSISGCEQKHGSVGWGFLVTRRAGEWKSLEEILNLTLDHCHAMRFRSGRQLLVCEDYLMEDFNLMHSLTDRVSIRRTTLHAD